MMLVLTRQVSNRTYLDFPDGIPPGSRVTITLVRVEHGKARIGFEAPPEVIITRPEIMRVAETDRRQP